MLSQREKHYIKFFFNIKKFLICSQGIRDLFMNRQLTYNLRYHRELHKDFVQSNFRFNSAFNRMRRLFNTLPSSIRNVSSVDLFKRRLGDLIFAFN